MIKLLTGLVHGLHWALGISTPPPEKDRFYVFLWLGIAALMSGGFVLLLWALG